MEPANVFEQFTLTIDPRKIQLLTQNAHYMRDEVYTRLVENVQADGVLTSTPFLWLRHNEETREPLFGPEDDNAYLCLSGNHRVRAAMANELPSITALATNDYLTPDKRKAIQLSHNAIVGEDDPALLKIIYDSIEDISMRIYTGVDDDQLKLMDSANIPAFSEANLMFQVISMTFLPFEREGTDEIWDDVEKEIAGSEAAWLLPFKRYDLIMDSLEMANLAYGTKNLATAFMVMLEIFHRHTRDLAEGWLDELGNPVIMGNNRPRMVPMASIIGTNNIPNTAASRLKRAFDKAVAKGEVDIEKPWEFFDQLLQVQEV